VIPLLLAALLAGCAARGRARWPFRSCSEETVPLTPPTIEVVVLPAVIVTGRGMQKVNLADKLTRFSERWSPRIVGELNGQHVKVAKLEREFVWHHHADADELFLVLAGRLAIHLRDRAITLGPGELLIVPKGVEHKPVADGVHVLLFEPAGTLNTGNLIDDRTVADPERL